jgi:hypothetical protein
MPNTYRIDGPDASLTSSAINRLQNKVLDAVAALEESPLASAKRLQTLSIATTSTRVYHGLGRRIQGWFVTRRSANATVYEAATQGDLAQFINLQASSAVTVDLVVF